MKIAIALHCYYPRHVYGTEAYVMILARQLKALGHEPTIISAVFQGEEPQAKTIEHYEWDGIPVISIDKNAYPHSSIAETYDQPAMRPVLGDILKSLQPDLLHVCHLINHTRALIDAAVSLQLPLFATLTDFFGFCLNNRLEAADGSLCSGPSPSRANCMACHLKAVGEQGARWRDRLIGRDPWRSMTAGALTLSARLRPKANILSIRPADIVERPARLLDALKHYREAIAPSSFLRDAYRANAFPAPLTLSHFGLDIDRAAKPPRAEPHQVRLGYMGQIARHKGVDLIIRAMRQIGAPNLSLTIWGDLAQDPAYTRELETLAAGMAVRFAGRYPRDAVVSVLAETDFAVIPSTWYENSPQSLMEALATHTPAIVSDVAGLTEFVQPGISGYSFARGDASALATVLKDIADNPQRASALKATTAYPRTARAMAEDVVAMYARHGFN